MEAQTKQVKKISNDTIISLRRLFILGHYANIDKSLLKCASSLKRLYEKEYPDIIKNLEDYYNIDMKEKRIINKIDYARRGISQWINVEEQSELIEEMTDYKSAKEIILNEIAGIVALIFEEQNLLQGKPIRAYELAQIPTITKNFKTIQRDEDDISEDDGDMDEDIVDE